MEDRDGKFFTLLQDIKRELFGIAFILMGGFLLVFSACAGGVWFSGIFGAAVLLLFGFFQVWLGSKPRDFK